MLAVNHGLALPTYDVLSAAGFDFEAVPREQWAVPVRRCRGFDTDTYINML